MEEFFSALMWMAIGAILATMAHAKEKSPPPKTEDLDDDENDKVLKLGAHAPKPPVKTTRTRKPTTPAKKAVKAPVKRTPK